MIGQKTHAKTKTNHDLVTRVSRALASSIEFILSPRWFLEVFSFSSDWPLDKFGFGFTTLNRNAL